MPLVGMTKSGCCSLASRSARSWAKATPWANSALCTATFAAGCTVTICIPRADVLMGPPFIVAASAASTVSAFE